MSHCGFVFPFTPSLLEDRSMLIGSRAFGFGTDTSFWDFMCHGNAGDVAEIFEAAWMTRNLAILYSTPRREMFPCLFSLRIIDGDGHIATIAFVERATFQRNRPLVLAAAGEISSMHSDDRQAFLIRQRARPLIERYRALGIRFDYPEPSRDFETARRMFGDDVCQKVGRLLVRSEGPNALFVSTQR
jgi:hypothetical protein